MSFYIQKIGGVRINDRIDALDQPRRTLFAMCCVTHGRATLVEENEVDPECRWWYLELLPMIEEFWESFPKSLDIAWLRKREDAVEELLKEDYGAAGEYQLKMAALNALRTSVGSASEAIYQVMEAFIDVLWVAEGYVLSDPFLFELMEESEACMSEMAFQLRCLGVIETWQRSLPNYEDLLAAINSDAHA